MFDKLIEEIKNYRDHKFDREEYLARIKALPENYQIVYNEMSNYIWSSGAGGCGVMDALLDVLSMLEDGAKERKNVLDIIGEDIIGFSDNLLHELSNKTWMDKMKSDKNQQILNKLKK